MDIALIAESGATASSVMTTLDMFRIASRFAPHEDFRVQLLSAAGGPVRLTEVVTVETRPLPADFNAYQAVILPGFFAESVDHIAAQLQTAWAPLIDRLGRLDSGTLAAASCYGTFVLAESGLLDGLPATTTWWFEKEFRRRYPRIELDADKTLADAGQAITAGAMTAHTDLSLHILRRLGGAALARSVGGIMLVDGAKASQRPFMAVQRNFSDPLVQKATGWMLDRLEQPFSMDELADAVHASYRTLNRRFIEAAGLPPLAYLQALKIERTKELLECTQQGFEEITAAVGYGDISSFRRLFKRSTGLSPAQYRRQFKGIAP